jgi:hypothetical protein
MPYDSDFEPTNLEKKAEEFQEHLKSGFVPDGDVACMIRRTSGRKQKACINFQNAVKDNLYTKGSIVYATNGNGDRPLGRFFWLSLTARFSDEKLGDADKRITLLDFVDLNESLVDEWMKEATEQEPLFGDFSFEELYPNM